jgi:threonine synthase
MHDTVLHTEPQEDPDGSSGASLESEAAVAARPTALRPNVSRRVFGSVFEMLPNEENPSPLVRINRLNTAAEFELYAKLEWFNPFGSIKDRAAWAMLRELELQGKVGHGRGLVEPTSGNLVGARVEKG